MAELPKDKSIQGKFGFFVFRNSAQEEQISMTMGRLKHSHLVLMLGISLFIPLFVAYSVYADLSETVFLSSDMSFEDSNDEDSSTSQNEFKVFVPMFSFNPTPPWTHSRWKSSLFSSSLTPYTQIMSVLRC